jgi:hypothetical protein
VGMNYRVPPTVEHVARHKFLPEENKSSKRFSVHFVKTIFANVPYNIIHNNMVRPGPH